MKSRPAPAPKPISRGARPPGLFRWVDTLFPRRALFQRDRRLLHLFLGRVLGSTAFAIVIPFLSLYLHGTRGIPMSAVGFLFFVAALAGSLGQIVAGEWSDHQGRKIVLVWSQIIRAGSFLGLGIAVVMDASFLVFALLTCLSAFSGRMFEPPSGAMVTDIATGRRRGEYFGVMRIAGNLGWALGPAIGGFLAALSYASLFFVSAGVLLAAGTLMAWKVEETSPTHRRSRSSVPPRTTVPELGPAVTLPRIRWREIGSTLKDGIFFRHCLISLIFFTVMAQLIVTLSIYAVEWAGLSKVELGTLFSLNGLMVVFLQFPIGRLTESLRLTTALALGSVLYGLGYGMMGFGSSLGYLMVAMVITTLGEIVATPPSMNLVANLSGEATRGRYMGVYGLFNSFGWSMGPLVGGVLLDTMKGHPIPLWGTIAFLALLAALGYVDLRRRIGSSVDRNLEAVPAGAA